MRLVGWERALAECVEDARRRDHALGVHDCCVFVCAAIQAQTGTDVYAEFRDRYHDAQGAADVLRAAGGSLWNVSQAIAARHGWPRIGIKRAQRGSPVYVPRRPDLSPAMPALGLAWTGGIVLPSIPRGVALIPLASASTAWDLSL